MQMRSRGSRGSSGPPGPMGRRERVILVVWAILLIAAIVSFLVLAIHGQRDPGECLEWKDRRHSWGSYYRSCVRWAPQEDQ